MLCVSCLHQAIEGFALMVKRTAQILQSFGTELAETELPNEIQATTVLLSTHTNKKDKMKVTLLMHTYIIHNIFGTYESYVFGSPNLSVCVCRGICWWLWVRVAGCWRASMSRWCETPTTTWTRTNWRTWLQCNGEKHKIYMSLQDDD